MEVGILVSCFESNSNRYCVVQHMDREMASGQPSHNEFDCPLLTLTKVLRVLSSTAIVCAISVVNDEAVHQCTSTLPEHPSVLISKETARNEACQTRHIRYINWPEIYMNPNDTILTPNKKYKRTCKWTEICIQRKNEKDTQTDTEYKTEIANIVRHSTNTNTVSHVPSSPQLNLDNEDNGCAESQISIGEEKRRMAQILGHINQNMCCGFCA